MYVIELEENYRSSPEILSAAFAVISEIQAADRRCAQMPFHIPARLVHAQSDMAEAIFIAKEIGSLRRAWYVRSAEACGT